MEKEKLPHLLLSIGLAFVFIWFGIDKFFHTTYWSGWIPLWLPKFTNISDTNWTYFFGVLETTLGISLFIPKLKKIAAAGIILLLVSIVFITGLSEIGIRDIALIFMALALLKLTP